MTVESATNPGKFISIPSELITGIGKSNRDESCGRVFMRGGICYVTRESFGELAQMVTEDAEVE